MPTKREVATELRNRDETCIYYAEAHKGFRRRIREGLDREKELTRKLAEMKPRLEELEQDLKNRMQEGSCDQCSS